jgi:hypothetical protein
MTSLSGLAATGMALKSKAPKGTAIGEDDRARGVVGTDVIRSLAPRLRLERRSAGRSSVICGKGVSSCTGVDGSDVSSLRGDENGEEWAGGVVEPLEGSRSVSGTLVAAEMAEITDMSELGK